MHINIDVGSKQPAYVHGKFFYFSVLFLISRKREERKMLVGFALLAGVGCFFPFEVERVKYIMLAKKRLTD